jgi:multidrug efflux pump subunit AcrB
VQQNIVRTDGKRSVLLTIIKNGNASTLDVVNQVKAALPEIQRAAPPGMKIALLFDQSVFVRQEPRNINIIRAVKPAATPSCRTPPMASIAVLTALGETINAMTLGGLALAVGILVDDSTVTIENTRRLLEEKTPFDEAVLEGAAGIAVPTLISTLAICCVFVSVFFLQGVARYLFTPLAMAVVFAMLASYGISRTLTPIVIGLLLREEHERQGTGTGWLSRFHNGFDTRFDRFLNFYGWLLAGILRRWLLTSGLAALVVIGGSVLFVFVGTDFFPGVDAGLIQLHVRVPARTRIERTEQLFQAIEDNIRTQIRPRNYT